MKYLKVMHIYCTDESVKNKLKEMADADERSMSFVVQKLIEKAYAEFVQQSKNDLKR